MATGSCLIYKGDYKNVDMHQDMNIGGYINPYTPIRMLKLLPSLGPAVVYDFPHSLTKTKALRICSM